MVSVLVTNNNGYAWTYESGVYFKGYFQFKDDDEYRVYREKDAAGCFCGVSTREELANILQKIDGIFAVIVENADSVLAAVDRSRSFPLYYEKNGACLSDSAEEIRKQMNIDNESVDEIQYMSLLSCDYLFGNNTVYSEIGQLDLGQAVCLKNGSVDLCYYFYHLSSIENLPDCAIKEKLYEAALKTFKRLKKVINNRPVVLSMSGGYDSRFVGCMLKKVGITDVSCYTYGKPQSFEVIQSKKNAEALGFRWICVEYTDEEVCRVLDETGIDYLDSYTGHDFTAYVQNFPAVRKLHEDGWFKEKSVFITGLCADMPTGNYVPEYDEHMMFNPYTAAEYLYKLIFTRYTMKENFKKQWCNDIAKKIELLPLKIHDYQSWVTAIDCIYTGTCHSHWFMHMNTVHSYFGYEWLLPCWSESYLKQWYSIDAKKRIHQRFYEDWLLNDICSEWGIDDKKVRACYSRNAIIKKIKYFMGSILCFVFLNAGITFRRRYDYNNFAPLELNVFKRIPDKKMVLYRKGGLPLLLNQYLLQRRYGVKNMKKALKKFVIN